VAERRTPEQTWVVGAPARPAAPPAAAARRAARLEARLAVYAHHAAALAEEAAATLAADPGRAGAHAEARASAAEHFLELAAEVRASGGEAPPFDALLSDALLELEHQAAVDLALRQRLVALREAVERGAAWAGERGAAPRALPAPAGCVARSRDTAGVPDDGAPDAEAPLRALERGLVEARADGVGRALAGQFPGAASRAGAGPGAGRTGSGVDLTF
jgi:hypothetical protein